MRNAINYSPDGGAVTILATDNNDIVRVEIKDQGVVISKEELPMIWESYYRTRGIKKRKIYGSGLGSQSFGMYSKHIKRRLEWKASQVKELHSGSNYRKKICELTIHYFS